MSSPESELARFVVSAELGRFDAATVAAGKRLLVDAIASAFAGRQTQERPAIESLARELFGGGDATILGGGRLAPAGAALLNGFQVTAATVCDVHRPTLTHVTPEVVPAALSVAESSGASGAELLSAVILGVEVAVRVAEALDGAIYRARGWHNPGVVGPIGAAVAVARLRRLDEGGVLSAIGHAASQSAGTFVALGTAGVKLHQARGAVSGLLAGELAAAGLDASPLALTAERGGLLATYAAGGTPARLTDGLGRDYRLHGISLRRWPAASSLQGVIAATLEAADELAGAGAIISAQVDLPPRGYVLNGTSGWGDQLSAMQSARWVVAAIAHDGELWIEQTNPSRLVDAEVARLADQILVTQDDQLPPNGARVTLVTADGARRVSQVDVPPGDPSAPLTDTEIATKLARAAEGPGMTDRVSGIFAAVDGLPDAPTANGLIPLLGAAPASTS